MEEIMSQMADQASINLSDQVEALSRARKQHATAMADAQASLGQLERNKLITSMCITECERDERKQHACRLKKELEKSTEESADLTSQISLKEMERERIAKTLKECAEKMDAYKSSVERCEQNLPEMRELDEAKKKLKSLQEERDALNRELNLLTGSREECWEEELDNMRRDIQDLESTLKERTVLVEKLECELHDRQRERQKLETSNMILNVVFIIIHFDDDDDSGGDNGDNDDGDNDDDSSDDDDGDNNADDDSSNDDDDEDDEINKLMASSRPPKHPGPNGLSFARQSTGGSYVQRFKIQRERIKTLHPGEDELKPDQRNIDKMLPKISQRFPGVNREGTGVRRFMRSNSIDTMKLPGVNLGSTIAQAARRRQPIPVKTFNMRLSLESSSQISKSLSSLPSIPGSPPAAGQRASPDAVMANDYKFQAFPGRHRYQKIAFQKTIHGDKASSSGDETDRSNNDFQHKNTADTLKAIYNNVMPSHARCIRRSNKVKFSTSEKDALSGVDVTSESGADRFDVPPKSSSTLSFGRHKRHSKDASGFSDTRSEGNYFIARKWKENCECLRCQMLRREYKEGDEHYSLWGQYPCHNLDHSITLDDDV
ncbi:hypothetical protein ElyMa_006352900 [Elysia marginata]|uniref:Uncharacterized protein n=1 Tax=Elysia marginata TaxID=1093978 RepID=A0AAV4HMH1_9GAST|nr:hypothetical protein ElyMa_006352900 [Elysia marginata]